MQKGIAKVSMRQRKPSLELQGSRFRSLDLARGRLALVGAVFLMAYTILALRMLDLSIFQYLTDSNVPPSQAVSASASGSAEREVQPVRRDIVDRNGVLLARSLGMTSLYADPLHIQEPESVAKKLAHVFPLKINVSDLTDKLASDRRFVWIKRHLTPDEIEAVLRIGDPGLGFETEYRRVYPQGRMLAHYLGYTDIDNNGIAGMEKGLDAELRDDKSEPLALSVDVRVQHLLRNAVSNAALKHKAKAGAGIVMNVKTGEVLAAVSYPDFDPHKPGKASEEQLFNRFSLGLYELGSTFKIFSTAAYLDIEGKDIHTAFDVREPIRKHGHIIRDYHGKDTVLTLPEVFIHSSNIGSAMMAEELGTQRMKQLFRDLGLTDPLNVSLPETGVPLVPSPWRAMNTLTASYGHGIAVTPLHFTAAASSVLNNGEFIAPVFIKGEAGSSTELKYATVSSGTSHRMRQLLRLAVTHGTGTLADIPGYLVGGKTGTAEKISVGGYDTQKLISSFYGMFPMDNPQYAVFIMIDEPVGIPETYGYATGGWVAAPAVGNVIAGMGRILGIEKKAMADQEFIADLQGRVRTNKDFDDGITLIPEQDPDNPPQSTPNKSLYQESTLASY